MIRALVALLLLCGAAQAQAPRPPYPAGVRAGFSFLGAAQAVVGGQRPWLPSDAVGVKVYEFDPSIAGNITVASGQVTALKSSEGTLTATPPTTGETPNYLANGFTGGPTIKFFANAASTRLTTAAFMQGPYWANYVYAKQSENTGTQNIIDADNFSGGTGKRVGQYIRWAGTNVQAIAFTAAVDVASASLDQGASLAPKILSSVLSSRTVQMSVNGGTPATGTLPGDPIGASAILSLGAWAAGGQAFRGEGAIWYHVEGQITADDDARMVGYLACRFNRQADLPASHPYKTNCPMFGG